jgi:hypothetical protein
VKTALDEARRDIEQGRYRAGGGAHANSGYGARPHQRARALRVGADPDRRASFGTTDYRERGLNR